MQKQHRILIIENELNNIKLFDLIFKNSDYSIIFAKNIIEAEKHAFETPIKLVIADYINAGGDLIAFFEKLDNYNPNIQKIILTDHIDPLTISKAINKGRIFQYLYKPIDPERLMIIINKAIKQCDLQTENETLVKDLIAKNKEQKELLEELQYKEEKFRSIFNSSSDPSFITDFNGKFLESNPFGDLILEKCNLSVTESYIQDIVSSEQHSKIDECLSITKAGKHSVIEVLLSIDNSNIYYELKSYPILNKNKSIIITLRDISARKESLKKEMQTIILTEEKERRRFAQELHDGIGPLLSTTKLYVQWFNKPNANLDKEIIVSKIEETIEESFKSIREISNNISPNTLNNFGLNVAIKKFIQRINDVSEIDFIYNNEVNYRFHPQLEITIYRILCEFINNTLKYANAHIINIEIKESNGIKVFYSDDGDGFDIETVNINGNGFGLSNMKARVESLGGQYELSSKLNVGTFATIKLPKN